MTTTPQDTLNESFAGLQRIFQPQNTANMNIVIQFVLTGDHGAEFFAAINNQTMQLEPGHAPTSKVSMKMPAGDFLDMLSGKLSTSDAFSSGKLKVGGNLIYAMKLAAVFKFGMS
jgi:putative sterol carrier protein